MAPNSKVLIKGATVLTMSASLEIKENCDILVENDQIKSIGSNIDSHGVTEVIDGTDCIVTPGFGAFPTRQPFLSFDASFCPYSIYISS